MLKDPFDSIVEEAKNVLEDYTLEEILELSDITPEEAVAYLVTYGVLQLPEVRSVR